MFELVSSFLVLIGFQTRIAAFVLRRRGASPYFIGHASKSFYPPERRRRRAILFSSLPLHLRRAQSPYSLDAMLKRKQGVAAA